MVRIGRAALLPHDLGHRLRADQVVQDRGAGLLVEDAGGDHRGGGRARDGLALLVDHEHPVGVAVEGEADVGAGLEDPGPQVGLVLDLDGVGRVVREAAVELAVEEVEVEGQLGEHRRHDEPAHAVGGVGDHLERHEHRRVDERADVLGEVVQQVDAGEQARLGGRRRYAGADHGLDAVEAGVLADRLGAGEAELDAVVVGRVVRRGEHRGRRVEAAGGEVHEVGRGQAEVDDVEALALHALRRRRRRTRRRSAACPARRAPGWRRRPPSRTRAKAAPMARHSSASSWSGTVPAHVVGLEDLVQHIHHTATRSAGRPSASGSVIVLAPLALRSLMAWDPTCRPGTSRIAPTPARGRPTRPG